MSRGAIIWWIIVIGVIAYVIYEYGFKKSDNKCCRISPPKEFENVPDMGTSIYCKRNGKYYLTTVGGMVGGEIETEISEQRYNDVIKAGNCK